MTQIEYKIVVVGKNMPMSAEEMNALGVYGWDLVRVLVIIGCLRMEYIFKRPKIQKHH